MWQRGHTGATFNMFLLVGLLVRPPAIDGVNMKPGRIKILSYALRLSCVVPGRITYMKLCCDVLRVSSNLKALRPTLMCCRTC